MRNEPGVVAIFSNDENQRYFIGAVQVADLNTFHVQALWEEWQEAVEEPDSDSQFIEWLVKEGKATELKLPLELVYLS
jgi:hypothetical protein